MASSSHMQRSDCSSGSFNGYEFRIVCEYKLPPRIRTSHSVKNPNRLYLRCRKSMGFQCNFFKWLDEVDPSDIRNLPEVVFAEERQKMNWWIAECGRLTKSHENDTLKMQELMIKVQDLKNVKKKMKKELVFCRIIICILITILLSAKLG